MLSTYLMSFVAIRHEGLATPYVAPERWWGHEEVAMRLGLVRTAAGEPSGEPQSHRHFAAEADDHADDLMALGDDGLLGQHEVDHADRSAIADEVGLQDEGVWPIATPDLADGRGWGERVRTVLLGPEEGGQAGVRIEARKTEPVDGAIARYERGGLEIEGDRSLARSMQQWLGLSPFAHQPRRVQ